MKMNMSEIAKRAGVNRTTLYRWKKEGVLESELAKLGVGIEPETAEKPKGILEGGDLSGIELKPLTPEQEEVYEEMVGQDLTFHVPVDKEEAEKNKVNDKKPLNTWLLERAAELEKAEEECQKRIEILKKQGKKYDRDGYEVNDAGVPVGIQKTMDRINARFGPGSTSYGMAGFGEIDFRKTGLKELDEILGGGIPKGRIIEIFGVESSGKTTLAIHIAKSFQDSHFKVAYIDSEQAFDREYAEKLGLKIDDIQFAQPGSMEESLEQLREWCRDDRIKLVIVDSVAAMVPGGEEEGYIGDANMGLKARMMSQVLRMISPDCNVNGVNVIFINQIRQSLASWGAKEYTPGGLGLKFSASQRIQLKIKEKTDKKRVIGLTCVKNKVSIPYKSCEMDLVFGEGFRKKR